MFPLSCDIPIHSSSFQPQAILKKYRFDIPPGLEHNQADWAKVISAVQDALTQKRSKIKKAVRSLSLIQFTFHVLLD
jgi:hypothetical protein